MNKFITILKQQIKTNRMNPNRKYADIGYEQEDKPQHQLQIISLNTDLQERFSPEKKTKNPWIIQPWQNQQQNPSQSPQRRAYEPRPAPSTQKKLLKLKPTPQTTSIRQSPKALESANNCNFSIRVRAQNRPSLKLLNKVQSQNNPNPQKIKGVTQRMMTPKYGFPQQNEFDEPPVSFKTSVPMIAYPLLMESRKRRKFRKIDKFQSYVSTSLRK